MKIHIPNSAFLLNFDPFINGFDPINPEILEITANKKWISLHPAALAMIASLGMSVKANGVICEKFEAKSKHYLERMGLFDFLGIESGMDIKRHESAGRFIPLTQIRNSEELAEFITEMIPLLHLEPSQVDPIRYTISEIVRNVLEHSQSSQGAIVCAQYFPKSNKIRIGIVDRGAGIKQTISKSHITDSHIQAIQMALVPGITGTTNKEGGTEQNAGAGLFFTKSIAKVNGDYFLIYSGDAMYKLLKHSGEETKILFADPFLDRHTKKGDLPFWDGTVVGIDLSLDSTVEFNNMLRLIREIYIKTVRDRKKEKYKKPKFI